MSFRYRFEHRRPRRVQPPESVRSGPVGDREELGTRAQAPRTGWVVTISYARPAIERMAIAVDDQCDFRLVIEIPGRSGCLFDEL